MAKIDPEHTPAPWKLEQATDGRSRGYIRGANRAPGAKFGYAICKVSKTGMTPEQMRANIRLIEAAPYLLAACIAAADPLNEVDFRTHDGGGTRFELSEEIVQQLHDAIALTKEDSQ